MSRILFVWELGGDLGHLTNISLVAREMAARGHSVAVAIKDLSRSGLFFKGTQIEVMQAPIWLPRPARPQVTKTIADILAYRGYNFVEGLESLVTAWLALIRAVRPDVIVCDYAPTAQFAARREAIPCVVLSNSFSFPEPGYPCPDICPWVDAPIEIVRRNEQRIVNNVNTVAQSLDIPPINTLPDLFSCEQSFVTELPIFDINHDVRSRSTYVGSAPSDHNFSAVDWGNCEGKRIFVYLKAGRPKVDLALKLLKQSNAVVRGYFAGRLPQGLNSANDDRFRLSETPVDVEESLNDADMAVFHASLGTLCQVVVAGKPTFALPAQLEQTRYSRIIKDLGVGDWIGINEDESELEPRLMRFIESDSMNERAQTLSSELSEFKRYPFTRTVCDGIEGFL